MSHVGGLAAGLIAHIIGREHVWESHVTMLADNGIGPEGVTHLASTLAQCLHMRSLSLCGSLGLRGGVFCLNSVF